MDFQIQLLVINKKMPIGLQIINSKNVAIKLRI